jgi:hypothetical protein
MQFATKLMIAQKAHERQQHQSRGWQQGKVGLGGSPKVDLLGIVATE